MVVWPVDFCMTMWLPFCRLSTKPCLASIEQTSRPESLRNLPNSDLQRGDVDFRVDALRDFVGVGRFKKQLDRLL